MALKSKPLDQVRPLAAAGAPQLARVNLNVPIAMRSRWKAFAAHQNASMTDLIVQAMEAMVNGKSTTAQDG